MAKKETVKTILVELDSLLDTRLGTIHRLNPAAAKTLFLGEDYYNRDQDDFEKLTGGLVKQKDYEDLYLIRDTVTLAVSRPTRIVDLLHSLTTELNEQKITAPDVELVTVCVNYYPYELTLKEQEDLKTLVYSYCDHETNVIVTSLATEDITPALMKDEWDSVILYGFNKWFCVHVNEINKTAIPRNTMFSAALYIKPIGELKKETPEGLEGISPFAIIEMSMVERLSLELLKPKEFSIKPIKA